MSVGQILVAEHDGVNMIRLIGDVRLTLCISFDQFIDAMFSQEDFKSVVFDLRDAEGIDSTTLGLIAKISIGSRERGLDKPVCISSNPSITRLLESMGFEDILNIVMDSDLPQLDDVKELNIQDNEEEAQKTVLEAHQVLMKLNEPNKIKFHELVETLEKKR